MLSTLPLLSGLRIHHAQKVGIASNPYITDEYSETQENLKKNSDFHCLQILQQGLT